MILNIPGVIHLFVALLGPIPEDVDLEPSPVSRGESYSSCAKLLWRGRRAGR